MRASKILFALVLASLTLTASAAQAAECDRACLTGMITKYVNAMAAHRPRSLPLAKHVRFTEDSKDLALGDGAWKAVTGVGSFRQDYIDVKRGIAASHVELQEKDARLLYSVLLRVSDRKITGIETLVERLTPNSRFQPDSLPRAMTGMSAPVPPAERMSREDLIRVATHYPEGLRVGNFTNAKTPFSREAYRVENGMFIAGEGCPRANCPGLYTQSVMLHPAVKANVAAVDEEQGIVLLWMNFGDTHSYGPGNALVTFEAFKIWGGEIHTINAFFRTLPKDTARGWEPSDPIPSLPFTTTTCDRACLTRYAEAWFGALASHDPLQVPIASNARYTEQTKVTPIGEGLWKSASEAPTTFKIIVADPVSSQVGGIVMMKDAGKPLQVGFRLKVANGQIVEAEHLMSPITNQASLANLEKPRPGFAEIVPAAARLPREALLLYGHGYYDSLTNSDGQAVPFADDCVRHENGIHTAGPRPASATPPPQATGAASASMSAFGSMTCAAQLNTRFMSYIEEISLRRVWIADEERGLVFGLSQFRHPMNVKVLTLLMPDGTRGTRDMTTQRTFDMAAAHVFKIGPDHKVHEIEATGIILPLNSPNGWSEFLR